MKNPLPEVIVQGEPSRLFPVLATTSKEGRTTAIVLACLARINEFGANLLGSVGQRVGARSKIETYTEIVCKNKVEKLRERPDGLIVVKSGKNEWRALVEAKVGNSKTELEQVERYRQLAKQNSIDCVITISNEFSSSPTLHPLKEVGKSRSKIPVYHWSWMFILTHADLLLNQDDVDDVDQRFLLNELRRFLTHESAGVKGFDRMPAEWAELSKLIASGGKLSAKSDLAQTVIDAWHQETQDLALILSRMTETNVTERLNRKHKSNSQERTKFEIEELRNNNSVGVELSIPDAVAPISVKADFMRRTIDVGMTLRAPEDKVSTKARTSWVLRQLDTTKIADTYLRLFWPGKGEATQHTVKELLDDIGIASNGKEHTAPHSFEIFRSVKLEGRFGQRANFIDDLENIVPDFYSEIGSNLSAWQRKAPKIKKDRATSDSVTPEALSADAKEYGDQL